MHACSTQVDTRKGKKKKQRKNKNNKKIRKEMSKKMEKEKKDALPLPKSSTHATTSM